MVKYILLVIFIGISLFLIIQIMVLKFSQLTEYGWGYFTGKLILLFLVMTLVVVTGRSILKKRSSD
jgi:hypothetical protein